MGQPTDQIGADPWLAGVAFGGRRHGRFCPHAGAELKSMAVQRKFNQEFVVKRDVRKALGKLSA